MIKFHPAVFNGKIKAPASEAHAQRLLYAAAMSDGRSLIFNLPDCTGIDTSISCLEAFGCRFDHDEFNKNALVVDPFVKTNPVPSASFNFRESSSAARFTLPLAASCGIRSECFAGEYLMKRRQMFALTSKMAIRGVAFSNFSLPFSMTGRLAAGEYKFSGDDDPQYICAFLMALPLLRDSSDIVLESPLRDESTVAMTIEELSRFGIRIEKTETGWHIPGAQTYSTVPRLTVENDWALANAWVTTGVFSARNGGRVEIEDLPANSTQLYRNTSPAYALLSQDFSELNLDCSQFPNMAAVFAAAAAVKGATLHLSGIPQLRSGDSDLFKSLELMTKSLGGRFESTSDSITVIGNPEAEYENVVIDTCGDPWMFISIAAAAPLMRYPVCADDEHGAEKIYRGFLDDYKALGGRFEIIEQQN